MGAVLRAGARAVSAVVGLAIIVVAIALILLVRTQTGLPSAFGLGQATSMTPDELRESGAAAIEGAIAEGGEGLTFEVVQRSTLYAKPNGPKIELRSPEDPKTVVGVVDEYQIGAILSRGGVTADAFWMDMLIARGEAIDFSSAELFARVLESDGKLWRDDGVGWYLTDESPGVGMDPATARALSGLLRSLGAVTALAPAAYDGRVLPGIRGTSTPDAYPGVTTTPATAPPPARQPSPTTPRASCPRAAPPAARSPTAMGPAGPTSGTAGT